MVAVQQVSLSAPAPVLRWYKVVISDGSPIGPDLRAKVQAKNPDAALRDVMRTNHMAFAYQASIWRLFSPAKPSLRFRVRCRVSPR